MNFGKKLKKGFAFSVVGLALAASQQATAGHLNVVLEADLDGREEVAADGVGNKGIVGDPDAKGEAYIFGIDGDPLTLCYLLVDIKKLAETTLSPGRPRVAHIHEGSRGSNGAPVANLAWPQNGQAADCLTEGEDGKFPTGEPGIVQRILSNPSSFYINIHNGEFPGGAIRGQLGAH